MRFKTRLLIFLIAGTLLSTIAVLALFEFYSYRMILREMREKALSIAATAATAIDGDLHARIKTREDENSDAYRTIRSQLRAVRDANRRDGTFVRYVYTIIPSPSNQQIYTFAVDAEESEQDVSHVGDSIHNADTLSWNISHTEFSENFIEDQWGTWLSAHAPIRDRSGKVVAALAVDIPRSRVDQEFSFLSTKVFLALGIGLVISFLSALIISRRVTAPLDTIHQAVDRIGRGDFDIKLDRQGSLEFNRVASALEEMSKGLRERETVKSAFASYVSHQVVDTILKNGQVPVLHGERRRITVLFCDIKGFTSMAERLRPETVVEILNTYFERVVDIIFKHHGTLDKFMGDGLMAIFGAPVEDPYQEEHAIQAALEMRDVLVELSARFLKDHELEFGIGIGINSGVAIVGNIGSSQRMDYTAIGDTVNLAARLESKTRELNADILISEETYNAVRGTFPGRLIKVGAMTVKGREREVTTWSIESDAVTARG